MRAAELFQLACNRENEVACRNLGEMYRDAHGVDQDDAKAVGFFQTACNDKDPAGCRDLAMMYASGRGILKDSARAVQLLALACKAGDEASCNGIGANTARPRPTADALARLLQPKAKGLQEMKTTGDERLWDVDGGLVPGGVMVVVGRLKAEPTAWHIGLNGKLEADDFGVVEKICGSRFIYYKIIGGPLSGAFIQDQQQEQFILANAEYVRAKWSVGCVGKALSLVSLDHRLVAARLGLLATSPQQSRRILSLQNQAP